MQGVDLGRKRFLNCTLSIDDVKFVKNAIKCTVNDVLIGVNSAALSRYYLHKTMAAVRENRRRTSARERLCSSTL